MPIGCGLEPGTVGKYKKEWRQYIKFCELRGAVKIPGRDKPWSIAEVAEYLEWRGRTNNVRSLAQIKSKLKHCGMCYNHLLPTAREEGPSLLRLQLALVCKAIGKAQVAALARVGISAGPKRSLALGRIAISLLFSAHGATNRRGFLALDRKTRHRLAICATMHTGCMRFELLRQLWRKGSFRYSEPDACWRARSDWHKMRRRTGEFEIDFPERPHFQSMRYNSYTDKGTVTHSFVAADVLRWQIEKEKSTRACYIFAPVRGVLESSASFQTWLRQVFRNILVEDEREVAALVSAITPHSFRAGMASDLERENVPRARIKKIGRWDSDRALEQYIRGRLAQRLRRLRYRAVGSNRGILGVQQQKLRRATSSKRSTADRKTGNSSEGYGQSSAEQSSDNDEPRASKSSGSGKRGRSRAQGRGRGFGRGDTRGIRHRSQRGRGGLRRR